MSREEDVHVYSAPIYGRSVKCRKTTDEMYGNIPGGNFVGGNFPGGIFHGGNFFLWEFSGWEFSREENFPRTQESIYTDIRLKVILQF